MNKAQLIEAILKIDPSKSEEELKTKSNTALGAILAGVKQRAKVEAQGAQDGENDLLGGDTLPSGQAIPPVIETAGAGGDVCGEIPGSGSLDESSCEGSGPGHAATDPSVDVVEGEGDLLESPPELPRGLSEIIGTQVLADVAPDIEIPPSETPFRADEVERTEGQNLPREGADAVVETAVIVGQAAGILLGLHPVTGVPVYSDEQ